MKFKQIACLFLVLHVSHLMVMSLSFDEQGTGTDKKGVAEEDVLEQKYGYDFWDLVNGLILTAKESKATKVKVPKSTCQLPGFRRLLAQASTINRLLQDLLERLSKVSYLKGV